MELGQILMLREAQAVRFFKQLTQQFIHHRPHSNSLKTAGETLS